MNIQKLTQRVEKTFDERQKYEELEKQLLARKKEVTEATEITKMEFWCRRCKQDTEGMAFKVVFQDSQLGYCAYYQSFGYKFPKEMLTCCIGLRRHITDKQWDDYYKESEKIRLQAKEAYENGDLLQPHEYGFRTKYGDANKKLYAKLDKEERANFKKKIMI